VFVTLVESYITAIKHDAAPDVDDAFERVAKIENAIIEKEAVELFVNEMKEVELSVSTDDLWRIYTNAQKAALNHFRRKTVHDTNGKEEKQAQVRDQLYSDIYFNSVKSEKYLFEILRTYFKLF
jgi:IS1 family transposase